jgi:hypothetical protein
MRHRTAGGLSSRRANQTQALKLPAGESPLLPATNYSWQVRRPRRAATLKQQAAPMDEQPAAPKHGGPRRSGGQLPQTPGVPFARCSRLPLDDHCRADQGTWLLQHDDARADRSSWLPQAGTNASSRAPSCLTTRAPLHTRQPAASSNASIHLTECAAPVRAATNPSNSPLRLQAGQSLGRS